MTLNAENVAPKTKREYRVAWEYARDLVAILRDEVEKLRRERDMAREEIAWLRERHPDGDVSA